MPHTAIIFSTHVINDRVKANFLKLRDELPSGYELFLFYDDRLSSRSVRKLAGDSALAHGKDGWKRFKRAGHYFKEKIPGNGDGMMLDAMDRLSGYDWFWFIEYDVSFSGDWSMFFSETESSDADLLAVNMIRYDQIPEWPLWKSIEAPKGEDLPHCDWIRVHLAISRYSKRINETLIPVYRQGWAGHAEALLATLAARQGLSIEDIGGDGEFVGPGNTNRFYRSTLTDNSLGPGTFVFRPCMEDVGDEPNMLWHPVKKASRRDWDSAEGQVAGLTATILRKFGFSR